MTRSKPPLVTLSRRARVLAAALTWSCVGIGLAAAGLAWTIRGIADGRAAAGFLTLAGAVGVAKGRWVLAPRARANVVRIVATPEQHALLSFFSPVAWGFVVGMMGLGWVLRHSGLSKGVLGPLYAAVGAAMLVGAVPSWGTWRRMRGPRKEGS